MSPRVSDQAVNAALREFRRLSCAEQARALAVELVKMRIENANLNEALQHVQRSA